MLIHGTGLQLSLFELIQRTISRQRPSRLDLESAATMRQNGSLCLPNRCNRSRTGMVNQTNQQMQKEPLCRLQMIRMILWKQVFRLFVCKTVWRTVPHRPTGRIRSLRRTSLRRLRLLYYGQSDPQVRTNIQY